MRMYARLKEPKKSDDNTYIYKIMLYKTGEGVYLFTYSCARRTTGMIRRKTCMLTGTA